MNGEEKAFLQDLGNRMTILETRYNERWDAHDKRSDENWSEIKKVMYSLQKRVFLLPCEAHSEKFKGFSASLRLLWTGFFVVLLAGLVFGVWIKVMAG